MVREKTIVHEKEKSSFRGGWLLGLLYIGQGKE